MFSEMIKKIKKFFTTNINIKIAALAIALILWIVVASYQSTAGKFPGQLQIKSVNVANGLVAIYDQKEVEINIMAKPSVWQKLTSNSFSAYVDLDNLQSGTYELDIQVVCNTPDVKIISKNPAKILVRVEKVISKKVSINSRIEGNAALGLVAGGVDFSPSEANMTGPMGDVDNINEAIAVIKLNGESTDFEKEVTLKAFGGDGKEMQSITFNPSKVKAKTSIVKGSNNKSVGIKVNIVGTPQDGFFISKITTDPNVINITGQVSALLTINYLETQSVDVSGINSNLEKNVNLKVPNGVVLQSGESNLIKVIVSLSANSISRVLSPKVDYKNLDSALRVNSYSLGDIKVTVSGDPNIVKELNSSNLVLQLDLSQKTTGSFDFPISSSMIQPIAGVTVLSIVPSSLQITLVNK